MRYCDTKIIPHASEYALSSQSILVQSQIQSQTQQSQATISQANESDDDDDDDEVCKTKKLIFIRFVYFH